MSKRKPKQNANPPAVPAELAPAVERLRKAVATAAEADKNEARKLGKRWANDHASPSQLDRLTKRVDELSDADPERVAQAFVEIVTDDPPTSWEDTREFWEGVVGENRSEEWETAAFVGHFAAGAIGQWETLRPHVYAA